jgi:hypothetical protein
MRVTNLPARAADEVELGVVYACVEGVNEKSFDECLEQLEKKAHALGATALIGLQLVQSQFQWNQRTSLLATAVIGPSGATAEQHSDGRHAHAEG